DKKAAEYNQLWDKYVRLCAEFDNSRKRWDKDKEEIIRFANFSLLKELIIILDELEQALKIARDHQDFEKIVKGIELTYNNFSKILKRMGVVVIEAKDKQFDPHVHEIVASKEVEGAELEHKVLEEVLKGYMFRDKVLRTSRVIIGIKKQTEEKKEEKSEK
ncbi:MAG: nucleotide exchange factor GrpE, partial [Candidatus Omnitrophota bacterium]